MSFTPTANQVTKHDVAFGEPFEAPPVVFVNPNSAWPGAISSCAGNVTADGFSIYCERSSAQSTNFSWVAIGA